MTEPAPPSARQWPRWAPFALVFAGLTAALGLWYVLALRDDDVALYRNLSPSDVTAVAAALDRENIVYRINAAGDVLVASSQEAQARRRLSSAHAGPAAVQGFELFDNSDMGLTDFAQKIKYQRALQGELERTIMMMDGVVSARVHISEPDRTLFESEPQTAKAAVTLVTRSPAAETPDRIAGIRRLIAAAVADLSVSDVVVLDAHGDILSSDVEVLTADPNARAAAASATPVQLFGGSDQSFTDLVTIVVGRAIPHTRFSVTVGAESVPASATSPASQTAMAVTVSTDRALKADELARVREALLAAAQASGKAVSTIVFNDDIAPIETDTRAAASAASTHPHTTGAMDVIVSAIGAVLVLMLLLCGFWVWRRWAVGSLTPEEQKSFAAALKTALGAEGGQSEPA